MSRRTYTYNGFESTLASPITAASVTITLASASGLQAPGYLVINPDSTTDREFIRFEALSAPSLESCTRGLEGTIGGAKAHDSGVTVRGVVTHQLIDDIFLDLIELQASLDAHDGAITVAAHPEATSTSRGFISATSQDKLDNIEAGAQVNPTALEIREDLRTVDGTGSGIDADLLDGVEGSGYAISGHTHAPDSHNHDTDYADINHEHVVPNVVAGSASHSTGGGATPLTGSFVSKASVTFNKPAGWNTYDIYIVGGASMRAASATSGLQARCTTAGSIGVADAAAGDTASIFAQRTLTGQSGSSLVCNILVAEEYGDGEYMSSFVQFVATRAT